MEEDEDEGEMIKADHRCTEKSESEGAPERRTLGWVPLPGSVPKQTSETSETSLEDQRTNVQAGGRQEVSHKENWKRRSLVHLNAQKMSFFSL